MAKTQEEIDHLKNNWLSDPCWDIENTEGFEAHYNELHDWRLNHKNNDAWRFRKLGAGISPTDYRETLSREGLVEYLREREANFEEIYQQEYDKRAALNADNDQLRRALDTATAERDAAVRESKGITVADRVEGWRLKIYQWDEPDQWVAEYVENPKSRKKRHQHIGGASHCYSVVEAVASARRKLEEYLTRHKPNAAPATDARNGSDGEVG